MILSRARWAFWSSQRTSHGSVSPAEFMIAFLEGAGGAVLVDAGHAHDDLCALFDRLPGTTEGSEVGRSEARLDRIEFDLWKYLFRPERLRA